MKINKSILALQSLVLFAIVFVAVLGLNNFERTQEKLTIVENSKQASIVGDSYFITPYENVLVAQSTAPQPCNCPLCCSVKS